MNIIWALWLLAFKPPAEWKDPYTMALLSTGFAKPTEDEIKKHHHMAVQGHPDQVNRNPNFDPFYLGARFTLIGLENKKFNGNEAIVLSAQKLGAKGEKRFDVGMHYNHMYIIISVQLTNLEPIKFDGSTYIEAKNFLIKAKRTEEEAKGNEETEDKGKEQKKHKPEDAKGKEQKKRKPEDAKGKEQKKRKFEFLELSQGRQSVLIDKDLALFRNLPGRCEQMERVNKGPVCIGPIPMQMSGSGANNTVHFGVPYHASQMPDIFVQRLDVPMDNPHDMISVYYCKESGQWKVTPKCDVVIKFKFSKTEIKTPLRCGDTHVLNPCQQGNENPLFGKFTIILDRLVILTIKFTEK